MPKGRPCETERVYVLPPGSQIGPIKPEQRQTLIQESLVAGVYEKTEDRHSAFEKLKGRAETAAMGPNEMPNKPGGLGTSMGTPIGGGAAPKQEGGGMMGGLSDVLFGSTGPRGGRHEGLATNMARSAVRTIGSAVGREIIRGVLGGIFGKRR